MALDNEIRILIARLDSAGVSTTRFSERLAEAGDNQERLNELSRDLNNALGDIEGTAGNLYQRLQAVTAEMSRGNKALNRAKGAYTKLLNAAQQLSDDEAGIVDLNKQQVRRLLEKAKINKRLAQQSVQALSAQEELTEAGQALLAAQEDNHKEASEVVHLAEQRLKQERRISKQMGVTGALIGGTGALMERLGMRSGIFKDAVDDAQEAMREAAKEADILGQRASRTRLAFIGVSKVVRGFGQALTDPATIMTAIVGKILELNKASVRLQRLTGQVRDVQAAHNTSLASGAQVLELMAEMTERTGVAASAMFSPSDLGRLAEAQNLLGLSAEQATTLGLMSKVSGTSIQGYKEELVESVNNFNAMNDSAVAHGVVMQDVLNASADVSMSLGGNPKKIAAAAAAARKLGLDLAKVNQIADGLLDFEDSIGKELEAQLLTGKNINLNKARELALNNDLEGLSEELSKNGASAAEFAKMNRIQQQAIAAAIGMSRDEMAKMLINQEGQKNLSLEQKAAMRGVTVEQLEQMEAAESLQLAFSKMAEPLASIVSQLTPIVTMVAKFISTVGKWPLYIGAAVAGLKTFMGIFRGIVAIQTTLNSLEAIRQGMQLRYNTAKALELGFGSRILAVLGFQNAAIELQLVKQRLIAGFERIKAAFANSTLLTFIRQNTALAVQLVKQEASLVMARLRAMFENITLRSILAQVGGIIKNIGKLAIQLGIQLGIANAALLANSAATFGVGAAIAVGAALAAFATYKSMTADDMVSPGYGQRTLLGPEGAIQLNNKDTVVAGTDLFSGGEQTSKGSTIDTGKQQALISEVILMRQQVADLLNKIYNKEGVVHLDGNKVGEAQVIGSYKLG